MRSLHEARGHVWRLIAAARGVEYPAFGLTSLLDAPGDRSLQPEMGDTLATLDLERVRLAAGALAARLEEASTAASQAPHSAG